MLCIQIFKKYLYNFDKIDKIITFVIRSESLNLMITVIHVMSHVQCLLIVPIVSDFGNFKEILHAFLFIADWSIIIYLERYNKYIFSLFRH